MDNQDYHVERARSEMDRAYRADSGAASRAHLGLALLHMKRMRDEASGGAAEGNVSHRSPNGVAAAASQLSALQGIVRQF